MLMKYYPVALQEDIVMQELENEILIYDLKTHRTFCLNQTSASVYKLCDGSKSVGEINSLINKKFNVNADEDLVWLTLKQLRQQNLIVGDKKIDDKFESMSRREVIRKIALTSVIALPLISSVVAPAAAAAASGVTCTQPGGGTACTTVANCPSIPGVTFTCNTTTHCCVEDGGAGIPGGGGTGGGGFGVIP